MEKLILNTEILSKMKVDLNRIYTGFDKVNEDILKIEEIVLKILEENIVEEDICNMYRILTDIEMYIFLKEDIENLSKEEIYNNVRIEIIEKYMYDFYVYIESIKKDFKENTFIYNFVRSSIYYFYGYKYYIKANNSDSQTNLKLERARIKFLKYIEKLEKENKYYDYNEDKEKLYFKTFKLWYDAILKVNNRKNNIEGIVDYLISKKQYLREKRNINQNIAKEIRENKEYVDYKFDYIKIMKMGFENLDIESNSIIEGAISTLIENERIDSSNAEPGDFRSKAINLNNSYMILKFKNNDFNNIHVFFHELRTYSGKNNYK